MNEKSRFNSYTKDIKFFLIDHYRRFCSSSSSSSSSSTNAIVFRTVLIIVEGLSGAATVDIKGE